MTVDLNDKTEREGEVRRGQDAKLLLENELLRGALMAMEKSAINTWKQSAMDAVEQRESAFRMWLTVNDFTRLLTSFVETGSLAGVQLETDRAQQEAEAAPVNVEGYSPNERRAGIHIS